MDLDHPDGIGAGGLVQAVDVLGHQRVQHPAAFELEQGVMAGVGPCEGARNQAIRPCQASRRTSGSRT